MENKTFQLSEIKADTTAEGRVQMVVSVFNNVDHAKDRIMPGFFADSLASKLPKGVWMHDWKMPVAKTIAAAELLPGDARLPEKLKELGGLWIDSQFNMDTQRGRDAFSDVKGGYVDEFSIGYVTEKSMMDEETGVRDLIKGTLFEWSPVLVGCNPMTAILDVKDVRQMTFSDTLTSVVPILVELVEKAESKAEFRAAEGRGLSADTMETLRGLKDRLGTLVDGPEVVEESTKEETEPVEQPKEAVEPESYENNIAALEAELELTLLETA